MAKAIAWMLCKNGNDVPVYVHPYVSNDSDLYSEAEAATFVLMHGVQDKEIAQYTLDAWMALGLEQYINSNDTPDTLLDKLAKWLNGIQNTYEYAYSVDEYIAIHESAQNWNDLDSLVEFIEVVYSSLKDISKHIAHALNQQFVRVRYGGEYNSDRASRDIWFRISSTGFNWADIIYVWLINNYKQYQVKHVNVVRDTVADKGFIDSADDTVFYKAKDGTPYQNMPIDEFLNGEHEGKVVFASDTICASLADKLNMSLMDTYYIVNALVTGLPISAVLGCAGWTTELYKELVGIECS